MNTVIHGHRLDTDDKAWVLPMPVFCCRCGTPSCASNDPATRIASLSGWFKLWGDVHTGYYCPSCTDIVGVMHALM